VDTDIHHLGWIRQPAIDYLTQDTALSPLEIANEVDRPVSWRVRADSCELGYVRIRELPAEKALGSKFDLRHFHHTALSMGSVLRPVLEPRIDRCIAEAGPEPQWPCGGGNARQWD
jgi:uncharacterized protein (DUF885 family)